MDEVYGSLRVDADEYYTLVNERNEYEEFFNTLKERIEEILNSNDLSEKEKLEEIRSEINEK